MLAASCSSLFQSRRFATTLVLAWLGIVVCSLGEDVATSPDTLAGNWPVRTRLETGGIAPYAVLTTEAWGVVSGGLKRGVWWNQLLDFGATVDTARIGAWPGGKFVGQFHWAANSHRSGCFADFTGTVNPGSGIMASDHIRVFNVYYQHSWSDEFLTLKIGQPTADEDFMVSGYAGFFSNSAFGAMPSQVGNRLASCCGSSPEFPIYPVAAPGAIVSLLLSESFYARAGMFCGRPGDDAGDNYGFEWLNQSPPELGLFFESGCHYILAERAATLKLGGTYHTGRLEDFSTNPDRDPAGTRDTATVLGIRARLSF